MNHYCDTNDHLKCLSEGKWQVAVVTTTEERGCNVDMESTLLLMGSLWETILLVTIYGAHIQQGGLRVKYWGVQRVRSVLEVNLNDSEAMKGTRVEQYACM